jgi:hypothetical protein
MNHKSTTIPQAAAAVYISASGSRRIFDHSPDTLQGIVPAYERLLAGGNQ